jgi:hypothetical protein
MNFEPEQFGRSPKSDGDFRGEPFIPKAPNGFDIRRCADAVFSPRVLAWLRALGIVARAAAFISAMQRDDGNSGLGITYCHAQLAALGFILPAIAARASALHLCIRHHTSMTPPSALPTPRGFVVPMREYGSVRPAKAGRAVAIAAKAVLNFRDLRGS